LLNSRYPVVLDLALEDDRRRMLVRQLVAREGQLRIDSANPEGDATASWSQFTALDD
jgi:hypothetical protein